MCALRQKLGTSFSTFALALLLSTALSQAATEAEQLAEILRRYPAADANRDGVLTREEAVAYAQGRRQSRSPRPAGKADRPEPTFAAVSYGPHPAQILDLWSARSDAPAPLVVFFHGGGFRTGSRDSVESSLIRNCLARGVAVMSVDYRFLTEAPIQEILRDCARSIQFVRHHAATYRIDPMRIACYGSSAGAGASLWIAFHPDLADPAQFDPVLRESSRIVAVAASNTQATYNLKEWDSVVGPNDPAWSGGNPDRETAAFYHVAQIEDLDTADGKRLLADLSMLQLASPDDPPVWLVNQHPDGTVSNRSHYLHHPDHSRAIERRCREVGIPVTTFFGQAEPRATGNAGELLRAFLFHHLHVPVTDGIQTPVDTAP
ncbi:MAG: alpha/beta hydrolase [Opitutaceae bacterium]|nr:alpha/beta hydrolase [Opitutaceae bacterium]